MDQAQEPGTAPRETTAEEIRTVEVRVPVIRLPKLSTGESITLPRRQQVAELCDYLADHLYEHRAALDAAQFRALLDEYARYRLLAAAGIEEYPIVIAE
jgi:hypothetical protein